MFYLWLEKHNDYSEEKCPSEVVRMEDEALLCHRLCIFVRWENGKEYMPRSISMLPSGLWHQLKTGAARAIREVG